MQIQLREGVSLRRAETALSGATHETARRENRPGRKRMAKSVTEEAGRRDLFGREAEK